MELPQELIDSIIDTIVDGLDLAHDPWIVDDTAQVLGTLRSCALVARAFVRPCQAYIFHGITLNSGKESYMKDLSALFTASPHLASHVRALYFHYDLEATVNELGLVEHILALLTGLTRLDIMPESPRENTLVWSNFLAPLREPLAAVFALPSLRHVTLWYFLFKNAAEMQVLLSRSFGLKTLVLRSIEFADTDVPAESQTPTGAEHPATAPQVFLDELHLYFLQASHVQALLDTFRVVDIAHLRSLYLHNTPMNALLQANATSIRRVKIRAYYPDAYLDEAVGEEPLANAHGLTALDIMMPFLSSLTRMLRRFGDLTHLARLHAITVSVSQKTDSADWKELDRVLGFSNDLPALKEVNLYSGSRYNPDEPHQEALLREWMPTLNGRGVLRIHGHSPEI